MGTIFFVFTTSLFTISLMTLHYSMKFTTYYITTILFFVAIQLSAQSVFVDGIYTDWSNDDLVIEDIGNVASNQLDIERVYVTNDDQNLYLRIDLDREIDIMDSQNISIHIDADRNANTGFQQFDIGTEFSFYLGDRFGYLNTLGGSSTINHDQAGLTAMPTVTSTIFEVAISRSKAIQLDGSIDIVVNNDRVNGDILPVITYTFDEKTTFMAKPYSLTKSPDSDFRIMSYNVERDGIFEPFTEDRIKALIKTVNPDIIAFQEIYDHSGGQVAQLLNELIPSSTGWNHITFFSDVMVFSKYDVVATNTIDGNEITLIQTPDGQQVVIVNVHLPCCDNDLSRQQEVDHIMSVLRDKDDSFKVDFEFKDDTPYIITGDFNFVGEAQNITSILAGDIVYEATYGADFAPDTDGSGLNDVNPYATGLPGNQTWYNPFGSYVGGKLDFFFYTGGGLELKNSFVLDTRGMTQSELQFYDLAPNYSIEAADHLPIVADFSFGTTVGNIEVEDYPSLRIINNPNSGQFTIAIEGDQQLNYKLTSIGGALMQSGQLTTSKNSIFANSKGAHILSITDKKGNLLAQEKIVIH